MIHMYWYSLVLIIIGAGAVGGLTVALVGWRRTYNAAYRLLDLLDLLHNKEADLDTRLSELKEDEGDS